MLHSKTNQVRVKCIIVGIFSVFLLPLAIPTNLDIYGLLEYNESLEYKYANTTEKLRMDIKNQIERLLKECISPGGLSGRIVSIYFEDKCRPVIDYYKNLGWEVTALFESPYDPKKDVIILSTDEMIFGTCLMEKFETHVLLSNLDECQKVIEYYLDNGYDLVDKNDEKVELIQNQGNETGSIGSK